jgi:hypothetical protein
VNARLQNVLVWAPRILGIAASLFIGLFALDAFGHGRTALEALPEFAIHLLPAVLLLGVVAVSWTRAWLGGVAFIALAVAYAAGVRGRPDWIAAISGPLLVVGVLFLISWRQHRRQTQAPV